MTLVNTILRPDRVVMFSDTLEHRGQFAHGFTTKFDVFPHMNAVMAVRGLYVVHHQVRHVIDIEPGVSDLADVPDVLPEALRRWWHVQRHAFAPDRDTRSHVWVAGHDGSRARAWRLALEEDFEPVELAPGTYLDPMPVEDREIPADIGPEHMRQMIRMQKTAQDASNIAKGWDRGLAIGGEIHAVELTRDGYTGRRFMTFPDKARTAALIEGAA